MVRRSGHTHCDAPNQQQKTSFATNNELDSSRAEPKNTPGIKRLFDGIFHI